MTDLRKLAKKLLTAFDIAMLILILIVVGLPLIAVLVEKIVSFWAPLLKLLK